MTKSCYTYRSPIPLRRRFLILLAPFSIRETKSEILLCIWIAKLRGCLEITLRDIIRPKEIMVMGVIVDSPLPSSYRGGRPSLGRSIVRLRTQRGQVPSVNHKH
jgi:hypothetical protein